MTQTKDFTWYRNRFTITWKDGSTETVVSHHNYERETLPQYGPRVHVDHKEYIEGRAVGYLRPWIRDKKVEVDFKTTTKLVLNFEQIESIEHMETEEVSEVVVVDE